MLSTFCFRLASGMVVALMLLSPKEVNPRFYRTHYLVALGLICLGAAVAPSALGRSPTPVLISSLWTFRYLVVSLAAVLCCLGSIVWSLENHPASGVIEIVSVAMLTLTLTLRAILGGQELHWSEFWLVLLGELTSAALLGAAVTAMLLGHFYLIAPGMSLTPLLRMMTALFVAIGLRLVFAGWGLWYWAGDHSISNLEDETVLWLPVRWGLGLVGPLVLGWMAHSAAKIRSTQSATGILYVVVIFCFLGELTSQLLTAHTGYLL